MQHATPDLSIVIVNWNTRGMLRDCLDSVRSTLAGLAAEVIVVALPCAWIYCVVGQHLLRKGPPPRTHPYRDWLMLYASPEFAEVQRWMRKKVDQWARTAGKEENRRMEDSFVISSRYEWMFWEMAWNEEQWPV